VNQWQSGTTLLHQRDEDIRAALDEVGGLRSQGKQRMRDLEEQKTFYENERKNNKEMEREVEKLSKDIRDTSGAVRDMETSISELDGQVSDRDYL